MSTETTPRAIRQPIDGVIWAKETKIERTRNIFAPGTPNRHGVQFENRFGRWLQEGLAKHRTEENIAGFTLRSGTWLRYTDARNDGAWAQPDHYLVLRDRLILFECKLSEVPEAWHQLDKIYAPLLAHIYPDLPILKCAVYASVRTRGQEQRIIRLQELLAPLYEAPKRSEWLVISQHQM